MRIFLSREVLDEIEVVAREEWTTRGDWIRDTILSELVMHLTAHADAEGLSVEEWVHRRKLDMGTHRRVMP